MLPNDIATAAPYVPFVLAFTQAVKYFLPAMTPDRQDSMVRLLAVCAGMLLSVVCYLFMADHITRQALGQTLGDGALAGLGSILSYHGVTLAVSALPARTVVQTPAPVAAPAPVVASKIEQVAQEIEASGKPAFPPAN